MSAETKPHNTSEIDPKNIVPWFGYYDQTKNEALAVSPGIGLIVIDTTLNEAVDELKLLIKDYLRFEYIKNPNNTLDDIKRSVPKEVWEAHTNLFVTQLTSNPDNRGDNWDCGAFDFETKEEIISNI